MASLFVASCTSGGVPPLELAIASAASEASDSDNALSSGQTVSPDAAVIASSDEVIEPKPDEAQPAVAAAEKPAEEVTEVAKAEGEQEKPADQVAVAEAETDETSAQAQLVATAKQDANAKKRRGFLSSLWSSKPPAEIPAATPVREEGLVLASATPAPKKEPAARIARSSLAGGDALPGVRKDNNLFEIKRKSGLDDDSDIDVNEDDGSYRVASAGGLARLAPNGLLTQREGVDVACLKPALVRVLKKVERHYGKRVVVTSGYRSPSYNRRARGARNSLHMYCAAADVQVDGVTKWELARYLRSMPGRGGVGTYCHTKSVHVDVGPERDWNWRCRRRGKRRG